MKFPRQFFTVQNSTPPNSPDAFPGLSGDGAGLRGFISSLHTSGSSTFWHPILLSPNGAHISTSSCGPSAGDPPLPDLQGAGAARSCSSLNVLFQCSRYLILSPGLFSVHFLPSCLPLLYSFLSPSLQCQEYRRFCPPGSAGDVQHCLESALSLLESTKRGWVFLFAFSKTHCCLSRKCSVPTR